MSGYVMARPVDLRTRLSARRDSKRVRQYACAGCSYRARAGFPVGLGKVQDFPQYATDTLTKTSDHRVPAAEVGISSRWDLLTSDLVAPTLEYITKSLIDVRDDLGRQFLTVVA